jgi:putative transposase
MSAVLLRVVRLDVLDVLCADFKGECMLGNRKYCYPLTITDYCSRYLLACESLVSTKSTFAFNVFERVKDYGLPVI